MFNDKKKILKLVSFLFIVLILSLNSLSASNLNDEMNLESEIQEDDFNNKTVIPPVLIIDSEDDFKNDSENSNNTFNNSLTENPEVIAENLTEFSNITVYYRNGTLYASYGIASSNEYTGSYGIVNVVIIQNSNENVKIDGVGHINELIFKNLENSNLNNNLQNSSNILILLNNLVNINSNTNQRVSNNFTIVSIESNNNYLLIPDKKENYNKSIISNNLTEFSCATQSNVDTIPADLNFGADNSISRNLNQNNQVTDFEKHSTSEIFKIIVQDLGGGLVVDDNYLNIVKIHSSHSNYILPVIVIQGNSKGLEYHKIYFFDMWDNPLYNSLITFEIDGIFYSKTTDDESKIGLFIDIFKGDYTLNNINCEGNSNIYYSISRNSDENLIESYNIGKEWFVKVFDHNQNPLINTVVTFEVNGIFYTSTTNNNGIATLNIDLEYGRHILTVIHPMNNLKIDKFIDVTPILKGEDMIVSQNDKASYKVKLVDDFGNPLAGKIISMRLHDVFYDIFTDDNGIASLDINLLPGYYTITSTFQDFSISNKVIVE